MTFVICEDDLKQITTIFLHYYVGTSMELMSWSLILSKLWVCECCSLLEGF